MTSITTMANARWRAFGLTALICGFLLAACYGMFDVANQLSKISDYFRTSSWIAAQIQAEYLRFHSAVSAFWALPTEDNRADMLRRFDIFWSRFPVALEGRESERVRRAPGAVASLQQILDDLPGVETELKTLQPGNAQAYSALLEHIERYRAPLQDIAQATIVGETSGLNEVDMKREGLDIVLSFLAVVTAGAIFVALVLRGKRQIRELYLHACATAHQLDVVRNQLVDAIESISESFALFDRDERLVLANSRFKSFYGPITDRIAVGATLEQLARDSAESGAIRTELSVDEWTALRLFQCRTPEGPSEQLLANGRVLRISDRRTAQGAFVSVGTDITDKRAADTLLEDRLAAIEASLDGLAIIDAHGRFMYLNRALASMHGYAPSDLAGQEWRILYDSVEWLRLSEAAQLDNSQPTSWRGQSCGQRSDGSQFPQDVAVTRLETGALVCVVRDDTARRQAEEERNRLAEQFHFAQRSEALGRLAGGIAHDFNNILGIIMGFSEITLLDLPDGHPARANLDKILAAGRRAKSLVQQILAYSRQAGSDRKPLRVDLLVKETTALLRATLPATIKLVKYIDREIPLVLADASQLDQIVMNLCVNAMHAIGERRGTIEIRLAKAQVTDAITSSTTTMVPNSSTNVPMRLGRGETERISRLWLGEFIAGAYVKLSIKDDGCGMSATTLKRIFDPFFTTKPTGTGTGLGLAAVQGIITEHAGAVAVETEEGVGTTFDIYLPSCEAADQMAPSVPPRAKRTSSKATLLVVDDEMDLAAMTCTMLRALGYSTVSCTNPTTALSILREDPYAIDLLITDHAMPGITGDELTTDIKKLRPELPIIMCTGFANKLTEASAKELGAAALLFKPVSRDDLAHAVSSALETTRVP